MMDHIFIQMAFTLVVAIVVPMALSQWGTFSDLPKEVFHVAASLLVAFPLALLFMPARARKQFFRIIKASIRDSESRRVAARKMCRWGYW